MVKPGRGDKTKVTVVPTTVEEKLYHDRIQDPKQEGQSGGAGQGEEGEVIGEQPIDDSEGTGAGGAGEGEGGVHEVEADAYELGKILTEKFELPNLQQKGKKKSLSHYTYDLTDKNRGVGQLLDKKSTLRRILQTNISLGRVKNWNNLDPTGFLVGPKDKVYRILSREKTYESQALVFFLSKLRQPGAHDPQEIPLGLLCKHFRRRRVLGDPQDPERIQLGLAGGSLHHLRLALSGHPGKTQRPLEGL